VNIETAITRIIDNWDDWQSEAGQAAQVEQDPRAGEFVLRSKLRDVLEKISEPHHA
jgi:hypothetical protein